MCKISFDIWAHLGNYHHNQDNKHLHHLLVSLCPLCPAPSPALSRGNHWLPFVTIYWFAFSNILYKWSHVGDIFFINKLYCLEHFYAHGKTEKKVQSFYITRHHTHKTSCTIDMSPQGGPFVAINKPTLIHHYHLKSIVYIRPHSSCCTFYRSGLM